MEQLVPASWELRVQPGADPAAYRAAGCQHSPVPKPPSPYPSHQRGSEPRAEWDPKTPPQARAGTRHCSKCSNQRLRGNRTTTRSLQASGGGWPRYGSPCPTEGPRTRCSLWDGSAAPILHRQLFPQRVCVFLPTLCFPSPPLSAQVPALPTRTCSLPSPSPGDQTRNEAHPR